MEKTCKHCGATYRVTSFELDAGSCEVCYAANEMQGFVGLTAANISIHGGYLFLAGLLLDTGTLSTPLGAYSLTVILWLGLRGIIAQFRGWPDCTTDRRIALSFLPIYGPFCFTMFFYLGQRIRYGPVL